ncbi:metal-dependent transcriptional regulator [Calidifontibacter sp. DB0510]|uniref:Manganese transport regulator n=2 Tax=Metallococcus carri TaxID=1656884 RepID=A0A967B587_9MICO|nr:metal-dependent transcriptional regulator [Metallococcus carri]NOP38455.1 metal-dependent transcriptional regulator [Calidifontibacter sp. DB2511S]
MRRMARPAVTRMVEDYLTLIWKAYEWPGGQPSTTDMAARLGVTPSTVSANLKKLARDGFVHYEPYGVVELTGVGGQVAVEIVRRHRIIETYLMRQLGLGWDQVHDEADRLEHAVSDLVLERMDAALGHPSTDPHGDPIPTADGRVLVDDTTILSDALPGSEATVARVSDRSPDILRYLEERGIVVGAHIRVNRVSKAAAAIGVAVGDASFDMSLTAAQAVRVQVRE